MSPFLHWVVFNSPLTAVFMFKQLQQGEEVLYWHLMVTNMKYNNTKLIYSLKNKARLKWFMHKNSNSKAPAELSSEEI